MDRFAKFKKMPKRKLIAQLNMLRTRSSMTRLCLSVFEFLYRAIKDQENSASTFKNDGGITAQVRRAPIGIVLCCGPFNYPFNV